MRVFVDLVLSNLSIEHRRN